MVDGRGFLPDSNAELAAWIGIVVLVATGFASFTSLDAHTRFVLDAPQDYFLSSTSTGSGEESVVFEKSQIKLMNAASKNSLGMGIGSERGYCGGLRNQNVYSFRLADRIISSTQSSVKFACGSPFDIAVHSQPDGSQSLSEEDRNIEGEAQVDVTCIQYAEIVESPVTGNVAGLNCWKITGGSVKNPEFIRIDVEING